MFDMNRIGKAIRTARIGKNMTQMDLADQMGVSYQAVSNWERGSSMPDIAKLETLSRILDLDIHLLLGSESPASSAVEKVLKETEEPLSMEELTEVAPILSPAQVQAEAKKAADSKGSALALKDMLPLFPYLDEELIDEILENIYYDSLAELACAAPFLSETQLDALAAEAGDSDWGGIVALAPFLSESTLDKLAARAVSADWGGLADLAPFLSVNTLDALAERCAGEADVRIITDLAPFLSQQALSKIVQRLEVTDLSALTELAPFLEDKTLDEIVNRQLDNGCSAENLSGLYPFLSNKTMRRLVQFFLRSGDFEQMKAAAPFL